MVSIHPGIPTSMKKTILPCSASILKQAENSYSGLLRIGAGNRIIICFSATIPDFTRIITGTSPSVPRSPDSSLPVKLFPWLVLTCDHENIISTSIGLDNPHPVKIRNEDSLFYTKQYDRSTLSWFQEHVLNTGKLSITAGYMVNWNSDYSAKPSFFPGVDINYSFHEGSQDIHQHQPHRAFSLIYGYVLQRSFTPGKPVA